ncbi:MAG: glycosyltransferase family 2 protein [Candidatus Aegiribacteria sp.]
MKYLLPMDNKVRLLVALPALNEEATIADVISGVRAVPFSGMELDVLTVDDGSSDGTAEKARRAGSSVLSHGRNLGLGDAFRTSLEYARENGYHILVTIDSDGQFDPGQIPLLLRPILDGKADFVTASRFADPLLVPDMPGIKKWGNRRVASLVSGLSGVKIRDATCGFRAYGPAALEKLSSFSRFTYTQEVIIDLASKGLVIREIPVKVLGRRPVGDSRIAGSLWRYAVLSLAAMYSISHDHKPWKFYGIPALILMGLGISADLFVLARWIITGRISPFTAVGLGGLFMITFAVLLFLFASLADTASHNRRLIEAVLSDRIRKNRMDR